MGKREMVFRGNIYYADLNGGVTGSEQGGTRPVLIIQNDTGNKYSPTAICVAITSKLDKAKLPTHLDLPKDVYNFLQKDSVILFEQIRTIDKSRLKEFIGSLDEKDMEKADKCLKISLALD